MSPLFRPISVQILSGISDPFWLLFQQFLQSFCGDPPLFSIPFQPLGAGFVGAFHRSSVMVGMFASVAWVRIPFG